jgi:hypothetical protein
VVALVLVDMGSVEPLVVVLVLDTSVGRASTVVVAVVGLEGVVLKEVAHVHEVVVEVKADRCPLRPFGGSSFVAVRQPHQP